MENLTITLEDDGKTLCLRCDLTVEPWPSQTGRTLLVGTTGGNQAITTPDGKPTGFLINASVFKKGDPSQPKRPRSWLDR
ncbi:MAG: hypothetical protein AB1646_01350 [Thermodesulfobacteriota bacterium]